MPIILISHNMPHVFEVADRIHYSNGLALVDGGKRLLVAEGMRNQVLQYTIGKEGVLSVGRRLYFPPSDD